MCILSALVSGEYFRLQKFIYIFIFVFFSFFLFMFVPILSLLVLDNGSSWDKQRNNGIVGESGCQCLLKELRSLLCFFLSAVCVHILIS